MTTNIRTFAVWVIFLFAGVRLAHCANDLGKVEFDGRAVGNNPVEIRDGQNQVIMHLMPMPPRPIR